jgi:predicted GTPase
MRSSRPREVLVVGRPNVGKTLFVINFAAFVGQRRLEIAGSPCDSAACTRVYSPGQARAELVDEKPHWTLSLQSVILSLYRGKPSLRVTLTDSAGLTDDIHPVSAVRRAMAGTLRRVAQTVLLLHVVDPVILPAGVDLDILSYGRSGGDGAYAILANKVDLPGRAVGAAALALRVAPVPVLAISALTGAGFDEVKSLVRKRTC